MDLEKMKHKYAYTLARVGLNVQKGQTVVVEAAIDGWQFTNIFAEECYKLGAGNVVIHYLDYSNLKVAVNYRNLEDVKPLEDWEIRRYEKYLDEGAAFCRLESVNQQLLADLKEEQTNAIFAHVDASRNVMRRYAREQGCQWLIATIPTKEWATFILNEEDEEKALNQMWELIFKLCYVEEDNDPVVAWENRYAEKIRRGHILDDLHLTKLHYTASNGTDLTIGLSPYSYFSMDRQGPKTKVHFIANLPTEEICTTPEKYAVDGVVYSTRPLVIGGKAIENFGFRFEKGKVVEVIAEDGKEVLEALINTDEGAAYLGEAALVEYSSPISQSGLVFYHTLIDENASCHLALGRGVSQIDDPVWTFNNSKIHIDFMVGTADMSIIGTTEDGREVQIFKNGDFAI